LKEAGIKSALVTAGGNIYAIGNKSDGSAWQVGIRDPLDIGSIIGYIDVLNQAVDTSGDYEQYFIVNDIKYGHILDPFTGYPPQGVTSCTIIADSPAAADALATGIFAMGMEKGLARLETLSGVEGLMIDVNGGRHFPRDFQEMFTLYENK
jgi:thiamine biosynthesis lipoprotein